MGLLNALLVYPQPNPAYLHGLDRSGKSTQVSLLTQYLAERSKVEQIRFPDRTTVIGGLINNYLQSTQELNDCSIHLLFSANRWESSVALEKKLKEGVNLVCDRYAYSGVAYSSAKGLDLKWCMTCDQGLPAPDCIFFLDIPVQDAVNRGQYGEERYEKADFQAKVRSSFYAIQDLEKTSAYTHTPVRWHVLDARKPIAEIQEEIRKIAEETLHAVETGKEIQKLWV
eukprot:gene33427-40435_t